MELFQTIKKSFGNSMFYRGVIQGSTKKGFVYYVKFSLLLIVLSLISTAVFKAPEATRFATKVAEELKNSFPAGLVINFKNGEVSVNQPEPITIPLTSGVQKSLTEVERESIQSLVVIDTKHPIIPDLFMSHKTLLLISKDFIAHYDNRGGIALKATKSFPDFVINEENLSYFLSYVSFLPWVLIALFGIGTFFGLLFNLVVCVFIAFIFFLSTKLYGQKLSYSESYRVCLYAMTAPTLLEVVVFGGFTPIPFLFSLLTILIAILATKHFVHDTTEVVHS
jgi:hypothetical protein